MIILKIYGLGEIALQISNVWLKSPKLGVQSEFMWLFLTLCFWKFVRILENNYFTGGDSSMYNIRKNKI